jgi:hypothetical protein
MKQYLPTVDFVCAFLLSSCEALIYQEDLRAFHAKHFPDAPEPEHVLHGVGEEAVEEHYEEEEDDGLGYYPDGTKRTLTDEQIAMFRHSEIQDILRKRRLRRERREAGESSEDEGAVTDTPDDSASPASLPSNTAQPGQPKQHQWATSSARTKAKNKRNRDKYKLKKRRMRLDNEQQRKGPGVKQEDEDSDEWDAWHQANGPDVQKEEPLELDY